MNTGRDGMTGRMTLRLWTSWVVSAGAWALHLSVVYVLVEPACRFTAIWTMHVTTAVALALELGAGVQGWRQWRRNRSPADVASEQARFLGFTGLLMSLLFSVIILAQALPVFLLSPCA